MTTVDAGGDLEAKQLPSEPLHVEIEAPPANATSTAEPAVNGHEIKESEPSPNKDAQSEDEKGGVEEEAENGLASPEASEPSPVGFNEERRDSRIADAKTKFETQGSFERKAGPKRKEKVKYAGLESAKTKFMDAATADGRKTQEKKKPKRITPPRDGNFSGVVESEPAERDPNVVRSDTLPDDDLPSATNTRSALAKFREIEKGEGQAKNAGGELKIDMDTAVTKNLLSVWKDRESNPQPAPSQERKSQVKIREEGDGGVYENNPEVLTDVVRATDQPDEVMPEGVDTRALRDRFLRGSVDEEKSINKLSALEEITQMTRMERHAVYENIPSAPLEGVIRSSLDEEEIKAPVSTKEIRDKFINRREEPPEKQPINMAEAEGGIYENQPVQLQGVVRSGEYVSVAEEIGHWAAEAKMRFMEDACRITKTLQKEKSPVELDLAEGGVFENEPSQRREDVVHGAEDSSDMVLPENTVKASLQRLKEIKEEASKVQTSKAPVIVAENDTSAGVYENVPENSRADACAAEMLNLSASEANEMRYAAEAKQRFLEKQKEEEEARKKKEAPKMIDIWADLCRDSGVFENKPADHDPSVFREFSPDESEEEEEEDQA